MTVTITGTNFTGATAVSFGGTAATSFTVVSATNITAIVASGTTGTILITTPGGTATSSGTFTFIQAPTISSFTPSTSGAGVTITITGTNLAGATSVTFGGTAATSFVVVSATSITAVVASGTTGTISVITPGGTATSSGTFTFIQAPTITSFTPTTSGAGATITITGTNFTGATSVTFGGTSATSFVVVSAASITAVVANGATGTISVTTPSGIATGKVEIASNLVANNTSSWTPAWQKITTVSSGVLSNVVLKLGNNSSTNDYSLYLVLHKTDNDPSLAGDIDTKFTSLIETSNAVTITRNTSAKEITFAFPGINILDASKSYYVVLKESQGNPAGTGQQLIYFNFSATVTFGGAGGIFGNLYYKFLMSPVFYFTPTITSFTPTTGGSGETITITGTNFIGTTSVTFGGTEATSFTVVSATSITAVVASGTTGVIVVTTTAGSATSSGIFIFTLAQSITSFSPTSGAVGTTITITGKGFTGATSVKFGGTEATSFVVVSATSITAVVASGTTGTIVVITPGGTATSSVTFTFIPAPTITSFTPTTSGAGATITITGTTFTGATIVKFGGTAATSFVVVSATSIIAVVATGTTGTISVTTPGGTATSGGTFTFIQVPTLVDLVYPKNDTTNIPLNLIFKWNKVSTATRYRIHISTVSTFATFVKDTIVTDTTFKANGLNVNTKYYWRVSGINLGGEGLFSTIRAFTTGTNTFVKNNNIIPSEFILSQNYPNPFNPSTTISFGLPFESKVRFEIYNSAGQIVKVISEEELSAGYYNYKFHIDVPTGIYFYRMVATSNEAGNKTFTQTKKMMLMK